MMKYIKKVAACVLAGILLTSILPTNVFSVTLSNTDSIFYGTTSTTGTEEEALGASAACDGHTLGTFSGVPACVNENGELHVCENNFPDENFINLILKWKESNDSYFTQKEIQGITSIGYQSNYGIESMKGIEFFSELTSLAFSYNRLTNELDLSNNSKLEYVNLDWSSLDKLLLNNGAPIKELHLYDNNLTEIDLSSFTLLTYLNCTNNELTELDVSKNKMLETLSCISNDITELDLSNNTVLTSLVCTGNKLTKLDISNSTKLTYLNCSSNSLAELDVSNNTLLTTLDVSNNPSKYKNENQLTELDVSNNTELTYLDCSDNNLAELDVSNNTALTHLDCSDNNLAELDVTRNTDLIRLYCDDNQMTDLDVKNNNDLTLLSCDGNKLKILDISSNTELTSLSCDSNNLNKLDISNNTALSYLSCINNTLTKLDTCNNTDLTKLHCNMNQLVELNTGTNTKLQELWCSQNQLTKLDVRSNVALTQLYCYSNQLTELDVSDCTALKTLSCSAQDTQLEALQKDNLWVADMSKLVSPANFERITSFSQGTFDSETGLITFDSRLSSFTYTYDVGKDDQTMTVTVNLISHVHIFSDWQVRTQATCTDKGEEYRVCSSCNKEETQEISPLGHSFTQYVSDNNATCTENGTETAKCDRCDVTDTRIIDNSALGHDYSEEWTIDKEATCTESGSKSHHCTRCDEKTDITEIPATGHSFVWVVDTPATEDSPGVQHEECSICGYKQNENTEIPQLPHVHTGITHHEAVTATCHQPGTIEYWTCSSDKCAGKYYSDANCTAQITTITTAIDPNNHDGGIEMKNAVKATCNTDGYTGDTYCLGCGTLLSKGTVIVATGHTGVVTKEAKAPTCTEAGWTEEIRCSICNEILQPSEPIAALGHSFTNYIPDNNATCTTDGTKTATCDRCHVTDTRNDVGSALGHNFKDYIADGNATCVQDGTATTTCDRCGATETYVIVGSALGHDMEERHIEPGFTFEGKFETLCSRCGESQSLIILPKKKIETALTDASSDQWFAYAIGYCLDYKLMQGTSYATDGRQIFLPDTPMTRAELVTVLYNMEGQPPVQFEAIFDDVTSEKWFATQVTWASQNGLVFGTADKIFEPDTPISRQDLATILYRYAVDYKGIEMNVKNVDALLGAFSDADRVGNYAKVAMAAMNQAGVITGDGDRLKPQENATRAEVASMLSRYLPNVLQADQTNG